MAKTVESYLLYNNISLFRANSEGTSLSIRIFFTYQSNENEHAVGCTAMYRVGYVGGVRSVLRECAIYNVAMNQLSESDLIRFDSLARNRQFDLFSIRFTSHLM